MRWFFLTLAGLVLAAAGCVQSGPVEKTLTIVNAAGMEAEPLEQIRAYAEKELRVPVRVTGAEPLASIRDFQVMEKAAKSARHKNDVIYIVVAEMDGGDHLKVYADSGVAVVNAAALRDADSGVFAGRIRRMVMRAAAFSFGLEPTPDPFCVTRDYRSLDELDRMGNNYSPPWQERFAKEAALRGLRAVGSVVGRPGPGAGRPGPAPRP